jgi:two-component system chemotaxis response regulator CheY
MDTIVRLRCPKRNNSGEIMAKALVVDDSRAVRMILSRTLKELGFEVREAANGREALELIAAEQTPVTLVLADWNMPEVNGLELLTRLRQKPELSSVAVIMVTTETELVQMAAALEAGANEYVMKPFTKEILVEKLELAGIRP